MIRFRCENCSQRRKVKIDFAGRVIRCSCGHRMLVPKVAEILQDNAPSSAPPAEIAVPIGWMRNVGAAMLVIGFVGSFGHMVVDLIDGRPLPLFGCFGYIELWLTVGIGLFVLGLRSYLLQGRGEQARTLAALTELSKHVLIMGLMLGVVVVLWGFKAAFGVAGIGFVGCLSTLFLGGFGGGWVGPGAAAMQSRDREGAMQMVLPCLVWTVLLAFVGHWWEFRGFWDWGP